MKKIVYNSAERMVILDIDGYNEKFVEWLKSKGIKTTDWSAEDLGEFFRSEGYDTIVEADEDIKALAEEIRNSDIWDEEKCRKLCEYAGLEEEWDKADGDTFESVLYKASEMLGVEII